MVRESSYTGIRTPSQARRTRRLGLKLRLTESRSRSDADESAGSSGPGRDPGLAGSASDMATVPKAVGESRMS